MKTVRYYKAYSLKKLREFNGWNENVQNARKEKQHVDGKEIEVARRLTDSDYLFLQDNFVVTDGILTDDNVIFDRVTPEWIDFCKRRLGFDVTVYEVGNTTALEEQDEEQYCNSGIMLRQRNS